MQLSWRWLGRAILLLPLLLAAGCSGVNASGSANPLMFLVPGLGQSAPAPDHQGNLPIPVQVFAQSQ